MKTTLSTVIRARRQRPDSERAGSAIVFVLIAVLTLTMLSAAVMRVTASADSQDSEAIDDARAMYLAEAGLEDAAASLIVNSSGNAGSAVAPVRFGDGLYWVVSQQVDQNEFLLRSTAMVGSGRASIESRVIRKGSGSVTRALLSNRKIDMKKGVFVDSYDSALGTYSSQVINKHGKIDYAGSNAVVISNDKWNLGKDLFLAGDLFAGPDKEINSKVGISALSILGEVSNLSEPVSMPPLTLPDCGPSSGSLHLHGNKDLPGYDLTLTPGTYHYEDFKIHKDTQAIIVGPATVVVDKKMEIDCGLVIDDTNGPVVFYVGKEAKIKEKAEIQVTSGTAAGLWIGFAAPTEYDENGKKKKVKHKVKVESNFTGVIYAPDGKVEFKKEANVFGSVMANEVKFKGGAQFHYDEMLSRIGGPFGGDSFSIGALTWRKTEIGNPHWQASRIDPFLLLGVDPKTLLHPSQTWQPQPFQVSGEFGAWGPDLFGWDESEDDSYDDPQDNVEEPDTDFQ